MTDRNRFLDLCGGVFEHSPWVAERAFDKGDIVEPLRSATVHAAMCAAFRAATRDERVAVLCAHPDLAGKLALAGELTEESRQEQSGAGLDRLSAEEHAEFTRLNTHYMRQFGFPFIIAVKGLDKDAILTAFRTRIANSVDEEFVTACGQVEKIARLRLDALLPQ
ncbi:MAG: 2-oxo-4-hydroxy-4-carboxy-5-ureidoimidazoline decarboxylase [Alphaproteobacteria bacterium]|nr:2-oxo-4-hydroxy-4-carboxy-5-ureidoimidazoline decarboxylase [Alphaproteobacteria bacterium]